MLNSLQILDSTFCEDCGNWDHTQVWPSLWGGSTEYKIYENLCLTVTDFQLSNSLCKIFTKFQIRLPNIKFIFIPSMFLSNLLIKVKYLQINWDLRPGLNVKYWWRHYCAAEVECVWFTTDKTLRLHHWIGLGPSRGLTWFIFHNLLMHFLYWKPTVSILWYIHF